MADAFPAQAGQSEEPASTQESSAVSVEARAGCFDAIAQIAEVEAEFSDAVYASYFARRPDTRVLFGEHSISEREEMVRETLRSLIAWLEGETWLDENLRVLGSSHAEYGVETDMYPPFVEALVESVSLVCGEHVAPDTLAALRAGSEAITRRMQEAGAAG